MQYDPYCLSAYLALRYLPRPALSWGPGVQPQFPQLSAHDQTAVATADEVIEQLSGSIREIDSDAPFGLLLSSGIDSAILAALLPTGSHTFTVNFTAVNAVNESEAAAAYAASAGLKHHVVDVGWQDYQELTDELMLHKKSPLHAVEVGLCKATKVAASLGLRTLVTGNGADSTFGGMDKLLSRDWGFDAFVDRYTFVRPESVLRDPASVVNVFEPYRLEDGMIDYIGFLKTVHGMGIVQAFNNAITAGGCEMSHPYEKLRLAVPLDLVRIRNGESKYILRAVFDRLYPSQTVPEKIPFARPMEEWLQDWRGPKRKEFRGNLEMSEFTGDQKWLIYCLERFLDLMEEH